MSLTLEHLELKRNDNKSQPPLLNINCHITAGEIVTVMGPSGSGKSTLLDAISGQLQAPFYYCGRVLLSGQSIDQLPAYQRNIGLLYQQPMLFDHLNVADNIRFALPANSALRTSATALQGWIERQLEQTGLSGMQQRSVATLSGGQQARVALIRTLAAQPAAVLLDEAFSKLDQSLRQQTREWTFQQLRQRAIPCLMVTHDIEDARAAAGPVIHLEQ